MDLVMLLLGRTMPKASAVTPVGGMLIRLLLMRTKPKRKSLISVGENKCVSARLKNLALTGRSYGKFRSVALMLLANVPPNDACNPPAPNGRSDSALEKKKRAASLSLPLLNSLSQLVENWLSVYLPGLLIVRGAVATVALQVVGSTVTPGVPGIEGMRKPLGSPPN